MSNDARLYQNNVKNRDFDKEAPQNFDSKRAAIAERQGASENQNSEAKPTPAKIDSSRYFGIDLIQDMLHLLREETHILASPEDANYFRSLAKKKPAPYHLPEEKPSLDHNKPKEQKAATSPPPIVKPPEPEEPPPAPPPPSAAPNKPLEKWRSEPHIAIEPLNFGALKSLFQKTFPTISIIDEIPNDEAAKKQATRWKTKNQAAPISILYFGEPLKQKALLIEIAKAIDVYFGPARLINAETIEKEKQWEAFLSCGELKLVIACDYTLWQLGDLMKNFKEVPSNQTRTLGNIPLFLLPDLSLYLKDPLLKRSLWKAIEKAARSLGSLIYNSQ